MKTTYIYILAVILVIGFVALIYKAPEVKEEKNIDETVIASFAQCLSDVGAKFYGAFWCPHCQDQKKLFKDSEALPYIECSTPDGEGQTQVCIDEKITGYPTWKFSDGTELNGVQSFEALAEKTNCTAP